MSSEFLPMLVAPARRALANANITSLEQLSQYSEHELLKLHGFGKSSIPIVVDQLKKTGMKLSK
jgi:DNA-directed RNA polymerase alpha subunit